jgi:hypothetical protein
MEINRSGMGREVAFPIAVAGTVKEGAVPVDEMQNYCGFVE